VSPLRYRRVASVAEARAALAEGGDSKLLAGGQSLLPVIKQGLADYQELIDIARVAELHGIRAIPGGVEIGAATPHAEVAASPEVRAVTPALAGLAGGIGDPQVRNLGTLGGSLAHADPAADYPAALLALGATVVTDRREIAADDFFLGLFETALEDDELITAVRFPAAREAAYRKLSNPASRYPVVGAFVARREDRVRVAITGAGECAFRVAAMEEVLAASFTGEALAGIEVDGSEFNEDLHASAEYRAHLVGVMVRRAVEAIRAASR